MHWPFTSENLITMALSRSLWQGQTALKTHYLCHQKYPLQRMSYFKETSYVNYYQENRNVGSITQGQACSTKSPDSGGGSSALSSSEKPQSWPPSVASLYTSHPGGVPMHPDLGLLTLDHK